ncbi:MAG: MCE family protein [Proteobacteria bacterium]|nr:MCE family protein [Pseudomonadota bacterium]
MKQGQKVDPKVNYTIVGLFVVILTIALTIFGFWLTGSYHGSAYNTYSIYMNESVSGLTVQSPVKFNGVEAGYVSDIEINSKNLKQVIVTVKVLQSVSITTSTVATMTIQGITGLAYVSLSAQTPSAPLLTKKPGERYPVITYQPSLLLRLDAVLKQVATDVDTVVTRLNDALSEDSIKAFKGSLVNIQEVTKVLSDNTKQMDRILKNTSEASERFPKISQQLETTVAAAYEMAESVSKAGTEVSLTMKDARTAIQSITQQAVPNLVVLINQMTGVANSFKQLSEELERNPSMVIRGKEPAQPGPGEK